MSRTARNWFVKHGPTLDRELSSSVDIEDHHGKAFVNVTTWANGEGFEVTIHESPVDPQWPGHEKRIELSWSEWDAIRWAVQKIQKEQKGDRRERTRPDS